MSKDITEQQEPTMLFEAPVTKVAPLHHDWKHYYSEDNIEDKLPRTLSTEEQLAKEQEDGGKEDS